MDARDKEMIEQPGEEVNAPSEESSAEDKDVSDDFTERDDIQTSGTGPALTENTEKPGFFARIRERGFFNRTMKIWFCVFFVSVVIYTVSRFAPGFAEFWTRYPSQGIRFLLAKLTGWIPFSFAETLILSLPAVTIAYIVLSSVSLHRNDSPKNFNRWLRPLVCLILTVAIIFFAGFGTGYGRYPLAQNLGLQSGPVSAQQLYDTAVAVMGEMNERVSGIGYDKTGASVMPYGYGELTEKMNAAFEAYASQADYVSHYDSNPKPIALSEPMTYTHIAGVYTFFTGESNVNVNYPDFLTPYTMAHEMSHQRGVAREDEANFVAYLVCRSSDDVYIKYCAYANLLNYLMNALYSADKELYYDFCKKHASRELMMEFISYSEFFDKYRDSAASKVSGTVNNTFLKSQGQSQGTKSYGLVVDLAVAYYSQNN